MTAAAANGARPGDGRGLPEAAPFGLALFLASLAVLFASTLVAYAVVRWRAPVWPPPGSPPLPGVVWVSTVLLLLSSGTHHAALVGARRGQEQLVRAGMAATSALALGFVVSQAACWLALMKAGITGQEGLFGWTFYVLTGLHGLHVLGGVGPLAVTTARAFQGRYGPDDHLGVRLCAMYWHFLDVAWLVIFAALVLI